jgi:hypothetical protein
VLQTQISIDIKDQKKQIWDNQVTQILALPSVRALTSPSDSLQFHLSARNRSRSRRQYSVSYGTLIPVLQGWASARASSVLLAQGKKHPKSARHFAVDIIETVRATHIPILWALAGGAYGWSLSLPDVFRTLTVQALEISRRVSATTNPSLTVSAVDAVATTEEWGKVLGQALQGLPLVYIVIDTDLFKGASVSDRRKASDILRNLATSSKAGASKRKIILLSRRYSHVTIDDEVLKELAPIRVFTDSGSQRRSSGGKIPVRGKDWRGAGFSGGRKKSSRVADIVKSALVLSVATTSQQSVVDDASASE